MEDVTDYENLTNLCELLRPGHNETEEYQLPEMSSFTQDDVDYCARNGWSFYVQVAIHLNPTLTLPKPKLITIYNNKLKLTPEQIDEAYDLRFNSNYSWKVLSHRYNVAQATIYRHVYREHFKRTGLTNAT